MKAKNILSKHFFNKNTKTAIIYILVIASVILSIATYYSITSKTDSYGPDPNIVMGWLIGDLAVILAIFIILTRKFFKARLLQNKMGSKLQNRMVLTFCIVAAIPTLVISIFSAYFFNFGIQSWFDQKINSVLDQSSHVAEAYIEEHKREMKATALSIEEDLDNLYYKLINNPRLFNQILEGQAEMRSLNEAMVFQTGSNTVLAKTSLSFSLSFVSIPKHFLDRADRGDVVEISSDPSRVRMLIKLREYNDCYLLIGRLIDKDVIEHIDQTHGALEKYKRLKKHMTNMQIKFAIIFIIMTIILLVVTIIFGVIFATRIVRPIKKLLIATKKVQDGDLSTRVEENDSDDEMTTLAAAFNKMVKQIDYQQKDLIIAQRSLAWADVARRVAHEIKNPLTPIQLSAERLSRKFSAEATDPEEFIKYTKTILRHTDSIKRIVSDFINFAKMPNPKYEKTNIVKLIYDTVDSHKIINDSITYDISSNIDSLDIFCDTIQINQVIMNLLKNAEESLENIQSETKIIDIILYKENDIFTITIHDNGHGIPQEILNSVSEPYVTTKEKGSGLGLAIVKKIIQDHYGTLDISNNNGAIIKISFNTEQLLQKSTKSYHY